MSEKKIVKFGVVGSSGMGKAHVEAMKRHTRMDVIAVCDKYRKDAEAVAEEYGVPMVFDDWHDLVKCDEIDAVLVCVPDYLHAEITEAALAAGKDVICEKPMALTVEDCERMRNAEKKYGKRLMIGQICRHAPGFKLAKEIIDRGDIGELYFVESEYAHDYSVARGLDDWRVDPRREPYIGGGCHAVDLLRWIAGDPYEVTAYSNHKCLTDWPVNDCTISILRFPNDVIGKVFVSIGCKRNYTMRSCFYGTKGTIICNDADPEITVFKTSLGNVDPLFGEDGFSSQQLPIKVPVTVNTHNTYGELESFADCILEDKPVPTTAYDGESTVVVCTSAMESAKTGKTVEIVY